MVKAQLTQKSFWMISKHISTLLCHPFEAEKGGTPIRIYSSLSFVQGSEDKPGQGTFGHIVGGYDAGYYGYTYSLVFAADMYARMVFKKASLDPALGRLYRDKILFVGGSRDDMGVPVGVPSLIMVRPDAWILGLFGTGAGSQGVYQ
ncbi:hypothetical protein L210DRAFT_2052291 [Boletus edulis BED1]|uniref:Peptidase M3A/M3B catalytic domain-containing protein n=1 Tax=Boletus edulis BED1 TaxID=1328754 RepID=A0AAD4C9J8_BOLED|nr:hypothetical protein L210DRAFT_2052291 [Boletus edulis BED1]